MTPANFAKYLFTASFTVMLWLMALGLMPSTFVSWFSFAFFVISDILVIAWGNKR